MGGDLQQALIHSGFESNDLVFLASDQLIYLEKLLGLDVSFRSCSSHSTSSSQATMEDEWSPSLLNAAINLQESVLVDAKYQSSADQQQQFWYEDPPADGCYGSENCYSYNYELHDQVSDHVRSGSKTMSETAGNDQRYSVSKFDHQQRYPDDSCAQINSKANGGEKLQPSSQKFSQQKTNLNSKTATAKRKNQEVRKSEPDCKKRPKNEADSTSKPSENKVRKVKMGNRITTLQQLVSPFGKNDTASVLSECIEYIKFLHEQVSVLSTAYQMKDRTLPMQHFQDLDESFYEECASDSGSGSHSSLRNRGLCIMSISSTLTLTNGTPLGYWDTS